MSIQEEKEWHKQEIELGLAESLRRFKITAARLDQCLKDDNINAAVHLLRSLDSSVTRLSDAGSVWVSRNDQLAEQIKKKEMVLLEMDKARLEMDRERSELQTSKNSLERILDLEKRLLASEKACEIERLKSQASRAEKDLLLAERVVSDQRLTIASLEQRAGLLETENSRLKVHTDANESMSITPRTSNIVVNANSGWRGRSDDHGMVVPTPTRAQTEASPTRNSTLSEARLDELDTSIRRLGDSVSTMRNEFQLSTVSIKNLVNRFTDEADKRQGSPIESPSKRRRLDEPINTEWLVDKQPTLQGVLASAAAPVPQDEINAAIPASVPGAFQGPSVAAAEMADNDQSIPSAISPVSPPWSSLVEFGGDQPLETEFRRLFSTWTLDKMRLLFEEICTPRTRTKPEKTCLTVKCGVELEFGVKHQFRGGSDVDTFSRSECPTHKTTPTGVCMRLVYLAGVADSDYVPGQLRFSVRSRI